MGIPLDPRLDFFTAELLNRTNVYVLAVIEHGTRRVRTLGTTEHPVQSRVVQQARNLLKYEDF
jgi:putative transposase